MRDKDGLTFKQAAFIAPTPESIIDGLKYIIWRCLWYKKHKCALNKALNLLNRVKLQYRTTQLNRWIKKANRIVEWLFSPENKYLWAREWISNRRCTKGYKTWRRQVLSRDNWMCQKCGEEKKLIAHHIKAYQSYKELRMDVNNGITLCHNCHIDVHRCLN